jgi:hypothetical protein
MPSSSLRKIPSSSPFKGILFLILPLLFSSLCRLYSLEYRGSFGLNYSSYSGPTGDIERIDGRISLLALGQITRTNRFFSRFTFYQKKVETMTKPLTQPSIYIEVTGPYYRSNWRLSTTKSYPIYGIRRKTRRERGSLRFSKEGLPTLSLDLRTYESEREGMDRFERDFKIYSEFERGPLFLRYRKWRWDEVLDSEIRRSKIDGNSIGAQLRFYPLRDLFYFLDYIVWGEEGEREFSYYSTREERLTTGFRGDLREGVETYLTFTGRRGDGRNGKGMDGNLTASLWLNPKPELDVYISGGEKFNFMSSRRIEYRYYTFGVASEGEWGEIHQIWRYSIRLNIPYGGEKSSSEDIHWRIDGMIIEGLNFDTYISLTRQKTEVGEINTMELNGGIQGYPEDKTYIQFRLGRSLTGSRILSLKGRRYTIYFNGSRRLGKRGSYSIDYTAVTGDFPSYTLSTTVTLEKGRQILSLTYTRSEVGVYNLFTGGKNLVETIGVMMRTSLKQNASLSINYNISRALDLLYTTFTVRFSWRFI